MGALPSNGNAVSASKANELIAIDITGKTIDVNSYTLNSGNYNNALYVNKTDGGANNIKNIPVSGRPFKLYVDLVRWVSTTDYITKQTFVSSKSGTASTYERWCTNGVWTSWLPNTRFTTNPTSGQVLIADGTNGGVKTSGYTIASSVPANAKFTDTNTTYSAGTGIGLSNTTFYNTGVRSIATGSTNGSVAVNTNGTVADVKVKGLNTLAYASGTWNKVTGTNCTLWYNEVAVYLEISAQGVNLTEYGGTATNKTIVVLPTNGNTN